MTLGQTTTKRRKGLLLSGAIIGLLITAAVLALAPAQAHGGNHGTIKVHDEADADPDQRNEPHVDCDFFIEGFNMNGASGELVIYSWPPTGDKTEVLRDAWVGTPETDGDGFHFLNGPYEGLADGHYRVEAFSDAGHPGGHEHFAKAKMFWVECDEVDGGDGGAGDGGDGGAEACPPTDLQATALGDGSIRLTFEAPVGADGMNIYRAEGSGDFEYITTVDANETEFLDTDTEVGTTYTYMVNPLFGDREAEDCEQVTVTAIPVFTSALAAGAASLLGVGAYAAIRRRR